MRLVKAAPVTQNPTQEAFMSLGGNSKLTSLSKSIRRSWTLSPGKLAGSCLQGHYGYGVRRSSRPGSFHLAGSICSVRLPGLPGFSAGFGPLK